jgi:hypothetical protein
MNYTKPRAANGNSVWVVRDGAGYANLSIPQSCWDADATKVQLRIDPSQNTTGAWFGTYNYVLTDFGVWHNPTWGFDGDWSTLTWVDADSAFHYAYINYTKPVNAMGATWYTKDFVASKTWPLPLGCWNRTKIMLRVNMYDQPGMDTGVTQYECNDGAWQYQGGSSAETAYFFEQNLTGTLGTVSWQCKNATDWITLRKSNDTTDTAFEEAMNWRLNATMQSVVSKSINTFNFPPATGSILVNDQKPNETDIRYYLSLNGINWVEFLPGVNTSYNHSGLGLYYMVNLSSTNLNVTPVASMIGIQIPLRQASNISLNVGGNLKNMTPAQALVARNAPYDQFAYQTYTAGEAAKIVDGDWGTYGYNSGGNGYVWVNATIPFSRKNSVLSNIFVEYRMASVWANTTLPATCWDTETQVQLQEWHRYPTSEAVFIDCWNGTTWVNFFGVGGQYAYEMRIWYNYTDYSFYSENITFTDQLNSALNSGACNCAGCVLDAIDHKCIVPMGITTKTEGTITYDNLYVGFDSGQSVETLQNFLDDVTANHDTWTFSCRACDGTVCDTNWQSYEVDITDDTCTPPSAPNNWSINSADNCVIANRTISLTPGGVTFFSSGNITFINCNLTVKRFEREDAWNLSTFTNLYSYFTNATIG